MDKTGGILEDYLKDRAREVAGGEATPEEVERDLSLVADSLDFSYEILVSIFRRILSEFSDVETLVATADSKNTLSVVKKCGRYYKET